MDYFSKALASLNIGLPFTASDEDPLSLSNHEVSQAVWKKDLSKVSVLRYALDDRIKAEHGRNAADVLRKLRIPGVARIVDTYETFDSFFVVIERVLPIDFTQISEDGAKFIALSVIKTLQQMYEAAKCEYHQSFTELVQSTQGLPLLAIFDTATTPSNMDSGMSSNGGTTAFTSSRCNIMTAAELISLIETVFVSHPALRSQCLQKAGVHKVSSSSESRIGFNVKSVVSFLESTSLLDLVTDADRVMLYSDEELLRYCEKVAQASRTLWPQVIRGLFLPQLIRANKPCILPAVLTLLGALDSDERPFDPSNQNDELVLNYITEQFKSMDRVIRLALLKALPSYLRLVSPTFVQTNIMPRMAFGFVDSEVIMRRASVAAVEILASKLSSRQRNMELLRLLAKTHSDTDSDVRALTTTVLCKIAPQLDNRAVVSTALARALKDPIPKCRAAALQGVLEINVAAKEIAEKLLGPAAVGMLDKDPKVSAEAWRVTNVLLTKIQSEATASGPGGDVSNTDTSVDHIVGDSVLEMESSPMNNNGSNSTGNAGIGRPKFGSTSERTITSLSGSKSRLGTASKFGATTNSTILPSPSSYKTSTTAEPDAFSEEDEEDAEQVEDAWGWDEDDADGEPVTEDAQAVEDAWGWDEE